MSNLDDHQLVAVESDHKRTLVMAGAGSGKTRVLVERIAYLIEEKGVSPYEIIALTFTRKAASEMKARLLLRLGTKARHIVCGTSHSIAVDMIRNFNQAKSKHSVYGEIESQMVLKDVAEELGIYKKKARKVPKKYIDEALLRYATQAETPSESDIAHGIFTAFKRRCEQNRALTYDDLLVEFHKLIPELAKLLNWRHVLVDECQDLTPLQWDIINLISGFFNASIFAVGDLDQSIYSFRGAYPEYLLLHCGDYGKFFLEANYRSYPGIVEAGNNIIKNNVDRFPKTSFATRPDPVDPVVKVLNDIDSLAIVDLVAAQVGQIAVLSRTHSLLQKVSRLMTERDIDHIYAGNKNSMLKGLPAVTLHAFLRLCVNPMDNFSFMVIRKLLGITNQQYAEVQLDATMKDVSHFVAWAMASMDQQSNARGFFHRNSGSTARLPEALIDLIEIAGLSTDPVSPERWPLEIGPVINFIDGWINDNQNDDLTVQAYLDYVALFDTQDEIDNGEDEQPNVILSTIHAAKGLEFDTVIIAGMNEVIFPSARAENTAKDMEDERRLAYVAITRSENNLIMTVRPEHTVDAKGNSHESPVSRFVGEAMNG
jgi:superfamily I DNA/RNA helicase